MKLGVRLRTKVKLWGGGVYWVVLPFSLRTEPRSRLRVSHFQKTTGLQKNIFRKRATIEVYHIFSEVPRI